MKTSIKQLKEMIRETVMEEMFEVGDFVVPTVGPHRGRKHKVIAVRDDGKINIRPIGIPASRNKYRLGAAGVRPEQLEKI